jgi:methylase of polypeptide subunit release factors
MQVSAPALPVPQATDNTREALLDLLKLLDGMGYSFITATPSTHARVVARPDRQRAETVRDVLGWSLPFAPDLLPPRLLETLRAADAVTEEGRLLKAKVRVSSVHGTLFVHSAYPTTAEDSVFLGPDSYRFADLILAHLGELPPRARILDYGTGAGVGGITAARAARDAHLTLADINPKALFLASINAEHGGVAHDCVDVRTPADAPGEYDLIVTHPPFMIDRGRRAYRDGGDLYGGQLSLDWTLASVAKLRPGGRFVMHTGVSIVGGRDVLRDALDQQLSADGFTVDYRELDPDIFGEELEQPHYAEVERIAAVGLVIQRAV